ncbi:hemolysin-III channel protein-like protein Izh2 [Hyaloscypha variabilis F]|uniref:Hemolysin-III channel protein-like protein Izh2 n=1 Tax=Hyaloscypha variabilis (strain UAMH 11265 / GT02V1 / F) TaxID=1149755 RepID=A0A2J6RNK3_HYAVF|nr:hemolysin-III channel protein-like protein Izh2 [Hyaloscypha variabilis F]
MIRRKSTSRAACKKKARRRLRMWGELDREDNHFIESGYRAASGSLEECLYSWTYIHNETVNIYTHLLGAAIFLALPLVLFKKEIPPRYALASKADIVVCLIYFLGVAICFCLSATYHTVMNHSQKMDTFGAQLDFQGVILLMWGATIPLLYYGFYCDFRLQKAYSILLSVLAVLCSMSTFQPRFRDPYLRPVRAATFGSLAIFTMVPVLHGISKYGWQVQSQRMGVVWVLVTLALNISGATAYAFKVPERWCKRRFDILGASHQIFHLMVVLAALTYTKGILQAFDFVHGNDHLCRREA